MTGHAAGQGKAECLTGLYCRWQMQTDWSSQNRSIITLAALPSAGERIKRRIRNSKNPRQAPNPLLPPLNLYPVPLQLCHKLCIRDSRHCEWTVSITVVLDTPFIQAKGQSRFTDAWYCTTRMTATTRLGMEAWVQEKKTNIDIHTKIYFQPFTPPQSPRKESVPAAPRFR